MDRILINAARLSAHIGVSDEERAQPQDLVFDITLLHDLREAGESDDFSKTICYAEVIREVETVAARVLADFAVEEITVRVRKPGAFPGRSIDHAAVEITRRRDG